MPTTTSARVRAVRQLYAWHKWTGLITGVFILFLSLTGAVAVFRDEIDRAWSPGRAVVAGEVRASVDAGIAAVRDRYPGLRITFLEWGRGATDAHVVSLSGGSGPLQVFIDPYTGTISGSRQGEHLVNVIRQAHVRFYFFGWQGRVVVGLFGLTLIVSSITGLIIYAPFMKAIFAPGFRFWHVRTQRAQWVASDTHKLVGIVAVVFNVVIAVTGAVLGLENLARFAPPIVSETMHPSPRVARAEGPVSSHVSLSLALDRARTVLPGLEPASITFPSGDKQYFLLRGNVPSRPTNAGASWVAVAAADGRVVQVHDATRAAAGTRLYNWMEPLHFGDFAGMWMKALYCFLGLTSGFLSITGLWLWLAKRRHRTLRIQARSSPRVTRAA